MELSIIIATMNRPDDLAKALQSIAGQTRLPDGIVIVDQSRNKHTAQVVEAANAVGPIARRICYVHQEIPSLTRARNRGVALARGELLSFIDDDVVLLPDYCRYVVERFQADPVVGAIGGSVLNTGFGGVKWRLRQILSCLFLLNFWNGRMTPSGLGYPIYHRPIMRETQVEMLHGCNMTVRRAAISIEPFDDWFMGYSFREDAEFSYRVSRKWKVLMIPEAQLYHNESPSNRMPSADLKRMEIQNYDYVWRKHQGDGLCSRVLFHYSLMGLLAMEWLGTLYGDQDKRACFEAALQTVRRLKN